MYKYILFPAFVLGFSARAQDPDIIRVKKDPGFFLFFQKGAKSDTVSNSRNNLFYFLVPDSLKESIAFSVENGQLAKTANDSLVKLSYLPGLRYEYFYDVEKKVSDFEKHKGEARKRKTGAYKTMINGTSAYPREKILLQAYNKQTNTIIYDLVFWYRAE